VSNRDSDRGTELGVCPLSRARLEILKKSGFNPKALEADTRRERFSENTTPEAALIIAKRISERIISQHRQKSGLLACVDTETFYDGRIRNEPKHHSELKEWVAHYGRHPEIPIRYVTSIVLTNLESGACAEGSEEADVYFNCFDAPYIVEYIAKNKRFLECPCGFQISHELWKPRLNKEKLPENIDCVHGMPMDLFLDLMKKVS